jgi:hypothetical protein
MAEQRWSRRRSGRGNSSSGPWTTPGGGLTTSGDLAAALRPAILTQHGLSSAFRALADRVPVPVEIDAPSIGLPAPIEASLYFSCSEALTVEPLR